MRLVCVIALCAFGAVSGTATETTKTTGTTNNRHRRSPPSATELFLSILAERPISQENIKAAFLPVQLPIQLGGHGGVTLPVLVLPVPVYAPGCNANNHEEKPAETPVEPASASTKTPDVASRQQFSQVTTSSPEPQEPVPLTPEQPKPQPQIHETVEIYTPHNIDIPAPIAKNLISRGKPFTNSRPEKQPSHDNDIPIKNYASPKIIIPLPASPYGSFDKIQQKPVSEPLSTESPIIDNPVRVTNPPEESLKLNLGTSNKIGFKLETKLSHTPEEPVVTYQSEIAVPSPAEEPIPFSEGPQTFETSEQMIQSFRRQSPVSPQLPAVIPDLPLPDRIPVPKPSSSVNAPPIPAPSPPRPDFNRSLHLRVDLTAPSSDYTEAYDIEWHAESNTAKTVVEDGSTIIYRAPLTDGRVQFLEIQRELSEGRSVRRCTLSPLMPASPADKAFPGLPELDQFEFTGYTSAEERSLVEKWRRVVVGGPGEGGAAQGESLTFTHELLIVRDRGLAVPFRYTVTTDSSVLGPSSDAYTHRYTPLTPPTAAVLPDTDQECDLFDELHDEDNRQKRDVKGFFSQVVSRFEPIREFAGPTRDIRYDSILLKFKDQFKRKYLDPAEEALRKTLLVKSSRFIEAGNRLSSGFKMATNFLADRLDAERLRCAVVATAREQLLGVRPLPDGASEAGLIPFPYSGNEVKRISNELGDEFDWRPLGAVSPVRFQKETCSSCWAFAVAGATEGALFKKTNKLVPLSPQCLVDCGRPFGANGCNGTWPSFAYDYVQARGLPAWDDYTDYEAKVLECKDKIVPPVTHISGHVNVTANSESALKVAIKNHAPNVVIVDAKAQSFIFYKSGVLKDKRCGQNKPKLNHAVLAVGWGTKDGPHFIIKNTWSAKWGEEGYIRIAPDACAVMERPSYPLIEKPNIDREDLRVAASSVN